MIPALQFLALAEERRALAFEQAATQRAVSAVVIEKDFWVCWLLSVMFSQPALAPHLVFKGGTSLSKVFGVIDRFSEDIDLSVSPAFVGADPQVFEALTSRTQRDAAMREMQSLCAEKVQNTIAPLLEAVIQQTLGPAADADTWLRYELDTQAQSPALRFHYPVTQAAGFAYIPRNVKLELGALTDQQPTGKHNIQPWVAEVFPAVFTDWRCEVTALELARTFWEKATILHAEYFRPEARLMPDRYARHYADFARLLGHPQAAAFLADQNLCARVVAWKSRVFASSWARYDLAQQGSFRLVPPTHRLTALEADYAVMQPMFLHAPAPFAAMMQTLTAAEKIING